MPREISTSLRRALEEPRSAEYVVILIEITHQTLATPIRVANDVVDYVYLGNTFIGFPFEIELVSDSARTPRGSLRIQNVDRRISEAVLELTTPPQLSIILFAQSDFEEIEPGGRTRLPPTGTEPTPEYQADHLILGTITIDASMVSGEILSFDMSNEPWPAIRATAERLPGLDP